MSSVRRDVHLRAGDRCAGRVDDLAGDRRAGLELDDHVVLIDLGDHDRQLADGARGRARDDLNAPAGTLCSVNAPLCASASPWTIIVFTASNRFARPTSTRELDRHRCGLRRLDAPADRHAGLDLDRDVR